MPLNVNPGAIGFNARGDGPFNKPFPEQLSFFKQKLNIPTERYDDILKSAHDRAFMVAGAAKADLLSDFRTAIDKAIGEGKGLGWFQKEFDTIVAKHGWDFKGGRDWRSRVIYSTNLSASYAAGRYAQLTDPDLLAVRPYWKYNHNDTVLHPRPLHLSWAGLVLKHDDPWWQTHFAPNGIGCKCYITAVKAADYHGQDAPDDGVYTKVDATGEAHVIPKGIDYGWDYAPGQSNAALIRQIINKDEKAPWQLARSNVRELVNSDVFLSFFNGKLQGEFPLAVLDGATKALLGAEAQVVLLSRETIDKHRIDHPEINALDYRKAQQIIDSGEIYRQSATRLIYLLLDGVLYRAALKRTTDAQNNYFLTLFRTTDDKAEKEVKEKYERLR